MVEGSTSESRKASDLPDNTTGWHRLDLVYMRFCGKIPALVISQLSAQWWT